MSIVIPNIWQVTYLDTNRFKQTLIDTANTRYLAYRQAGHEVYDGLRLVRETKLAIWFVLSMWDHNSLVTDELVFWTQRPNLVRADLSRLKRKCDSSYLNLKLPLQASTGVANNISKVTPRKDDQARYFVCCNPCTDSQLRFVDYLLPHLLHTSLRLKPMLITVRCDTA